jgi:hypothetical protein
MKAKMSLQISLGAKSISKGGLRLKKFGRTEETERKAQTTTERRPAVGRGENQGGFGNLRGSERHFELVDGMNQ